MLNAQISYTPSVIINIQNHIHYTGKWYSGDKDVIFAGERDFIWYYKVYYVCSTKQPRLDFLFSTSDFVHCDLLTPSQSPSRH